MNKFIWQVILVAAIYIIFVFLWGCIIKIAIIANVNGAFNVFGDFWGSWSVYFGIIISITAIFSPLLLRKFLKGEIKIAVLSVLIAVIFSILAVSSFFVTAAQFREFTPERWSKYTNERYIMLEDLKSKAIIGTEKERALELLGAPDGTLIADALVYSYGNGDIAFSLDKNDVIQAVYLH
ncbi:MAG: hypothetical protein LBL58_15390 [Tannerellaceae bacterium]|jgi:hypothetical protein|nr:hypothetical protein [Tannerellaceae bacterium]